MADTVEIKIQVTAPGAKEILQSLAQGGDALTDSLKSVTVGASGADHSVRDLAAGIALGELAVKALEEAVHLVVEGFGKLVEIGKQAVDAAAEHQTAVVRLNAALKGQGEFSSELSGELVELAERYERVTTNQHDQIIAAERILIQFGATREEVKLLLPAVLDLATKTGSLETAALQTGRALDGQVTALKRSGVAIDDHADRQHRAAAIASGIEGIYRGQAEALGQTYTGALTQAANAWTFLSEKVGAAITDNDAVLSTIHLVANQLFDAGDSATEFGDKLDHLVTQGVLALLDSMPQIAPVAVEVGVTIFELAKVFGEFTLDLVKSASSILDFTTALKVIGDIAIGAGIGSLNVPLLLAGAAARAAAGGMDDLREKLKEVAPAVATDVAALQEGEDAFLKNAAATAENVRANEAFNVSVASIGKDAQDAFNKLKNAAGQVDLKQFLKTDEAQRFAQALEDAAKKHEPLSLANQALARQLGIYKIVAEDAGSGTRNLGDSNDKAAKEVEKLRLEIEAQIIAAQAEAQVIEDGVAKGQSLEEINLRVALAKKEAEAAAQGHLGALQKEFDAYEKLIPTLAQHEQHLKLVKQAEQESFQLDDKLKALNGEQTALEGVIGANASYLDIQKSIAVAQAASKGANAEEQKDLAAKAATVFDLTQKIKDEADAEKQRFDNAAQLDELKAEVDIYKQQSDGLLTLTQATKAVAIAQAELHAEQAKGRALTDQEKADIETQIGALEDWKHAVEENAKAAQLASINVADEFGKLSDAMIEAFAHGQNAAQAFGSALESILLDAFKNVIKSKLTTLDESFSGNFLSYLPGLAKQGASFISDTFQGLFSNLATQSSEATSASGGGMGSNLSNFGSVLNLGQRAYSLFAGSGAGVSDAATSGAFTFSQAESLGGVPVSIENMSPAVQSVLETQAANDAAAQAAGLADSSQAASLLGSNDALSGAAGETLGGGASAGLGGLAASASLYGGIALAVLGAISVASGIASANNAKTALNESQFQKQVFSGIPQWLQGVGTITNPLGVFGALGIGGAGGAGLGSPQSDFAASYGLLHGQANFVNILSAITDPIMLALAAFAHIPTQGTALRKGTEEFFESKDNAIPFFDVNSGTFDRSVGQAEAKQLALNHPDLNSDQAFQAGMQDFINQQQTSIGLTDKQLAQFKAMDTALLAFTTQGGKGLADIDTHLLGNLGALLGNIANKGLDAQSAMQVLTKAVQDLGPPQLVVNQLTASFKAGVLNVDNYKAAVVGYTEALNQSVPLGVRPAEIALEEVNKAMADGGAGAINYETIKQRLQDVGAAAQLIVPALQQVAQTAYQLTPAQFAAQKPKLEQGALDGIQQAITSTVEKGFTDGMIQSALQPEVLEPLTHTLTKVFGDLQAGTITPDDALHAITDAENAAKTAMQGLKPFIDQLLSGANELGNVFSQASDDVVGLATAIAKLEDAQRSFDQSLNQRISALRNNGTTAPDVLRAQLPAIQHEVALTQDEYFGSGNQHGEHGFDEQLAALVKMQTLGEQFTAIRIQAIQNEAAIAIKGHEDTIKSLQREAQAKQQAAQDAVQADQDKLDVLQKQLQVVQQWAAVVDQTKSTILSIRTGSDSIQNPLARLQLAQQQLAQQQQTFNTSTDVAERAKAAGEINKLAPQILQLAQQAGLAQSSEAYRAIYTSVVGALDKVQGTAATAEGSQTPEEIQKHIAAIQDDIKSIQKQSQAELRSINDNIQSEQDAITSAQDTANTKIQKANQDLSDLLAWEKGAGDQIYQQKQNELQAKLDGLGVTSTDISSIAAESLSQLEEIVSILSGHGDTVTRFGPGQFGITKTDQAAVQSNLAGFAPGGGTQAQFATLASTNLTLPQLKASTDPFIQYIMARFPTIASTADFRTVAQAIVDKINAPTKYQDVLGFDVGVVATRPTAGVFGERGPEALVPLSRFPEFLRGIPAATTAPIHSTQNNTITMNVYGGALANDPRALIRKISDEVREQMRHPDPTTLKTLARKVRYANASAV